MRFKGLDEIDQAIINLLAHNARMSYVDIGNVVGLSRVAVKTRIQAMEDKGIIEEYTTVINPQKISSSISAYFEIEVAPLHFSAVIEQLKRNESVTQIYHVSGKNKLHVHVVCAGNDEMERFLNEVIARLPGITDLTCNVILARIKDIKAHRL